MRVKISLLMFVLFISGCAWGTRRPFLTYSPILKPQPKNSIDLRIKTFEDKRSEKDIIGYSRNSYGHRCAKVIAQNNIAEWVTNALKTELTNAGYSISDQETTPNVIEGTVFDVFCDSYADYDGSVGIKVALKREDKVVLEKDYSAKQSKLNLGSGPNYGAGVFGLLGASTLGTTRDKAYAKTLEMALQDILKQVVIDINKELLK